MEYTTVSGDTWDSIAFKLFGSEKFARQLMDHNKQHLQIVIFSSGIILKVPEITTGESTEINLPPWRL